MSVLGEDAGDTIDGVRLVEGDRITINAHYPRWKRIVFPKVRRAARAQKRERENPGIWKVS